jgi:hypothetical protein
VPSRCGYGRVPAAGRDRGRRRAAPSWVESTASVVASSACGSRARSKGRRRVRVRDLPAGRRRVVVVWCKRIWRCPDPDCAVGSWTEHSSEIGPRAPMTRRAGPRPAARSGARRRAALAWSFGVGPAARFPQASRTGTHLDRVVGRLGAASRWHVKIRVAETRAI